MTAGELINKINSMGTLKEILSDYSLIEEILSYEDKYLIYVFAEMINFSLSVKELIAADLESLSDGRLLISLINTNKEELLVEKIKYISRINDANTQISLFSNPFVLNLVANNSLNNDVFYRLCLDTKLVVIEGLIKMNYYEKALELTGILNQTMTNIRKYNEEKEKSPVSKCLKTCK